MANWIPVTPGKLITFATQVTIAKWISVTPKNSRETDKFATEVATAGPILLILLRSG